MVAKKSKDRKETGKLALKKETLQDLSAKGSARAVRAGRAQRGGDDSGPVCSVACLRTMLVCPGTR